MRAAIAIFSVLALFAAQVFADELHAPYAPAVTARNRLGRNPVQARDDESEWANPCS